MVKSSFSPEPVRDMCYYHYFPNIIMKNIDKAKWQEKVGFNFKEKKQNYD